MKTKATFVFILAVVFSLSTATYAEEQFMEVVVQKRDCLIRICDKYLDAPDAWREIAKVNKLKNPDLILPGQRLLVPVSLVQGVHLDASVTFVKGEVQLLPKGSESWQPLRLNDRVSQGDGVKTGADGTVELTFEDDTALLIKTNTSLVVNKSTQTKAFSAIRDFFLGIGRIISRVKTATGSDSRFSVRTPSAIAAVRGTEYRVSVDEQEVTRAEVLLGTVTIQAKANTVEVNEGEGTLVRKDEPPVSPVKLLSPPIPVSIEPLYRVMPIMLSFGFVPGATAYRVALAKDKYMKDEVFDRVTPADQPLRIDKVEDGAYFMQSQSIDENGIEGTPSEPVAFNIRIHPLPPIIEKPEDKSELHRPGVNMIWLKCSDASGYHIQVAEDHEFKDVTEDKNFLKETEFDIPRLPSRTYYFRICSVAEDGYEGVWSDTLRFTIVPPPPAPAVEKPEVAEKEVRLRWRNLGEGITYHFQMASDKAFGSVIVDRKVDRPETVIERPAEPGIYYVRTSGIDSTGYEGDFSPAQSFEVESEVNYMLIGGAAGAVIGTVLLILLL
jgi:FecR protein/LysM domain